METEIIEFLREKFREKMGRNVGDSEINDWDTADGDDYFCDKEKITVYLELPNKINTKV